MYETSQKILGTDNKIALCVCMIARFSKVCLQYCKTTIQNGDRGSMYFHPDHVNENRLSSSLLDDELQFSYINSHLLNSYIRNHYKNVTKTS